MKSENQSLRIGAIAIAGAILLRLLGGNYLGKLVQFFSRPEAMTTVLFLQTGLVVRGPSPTEPSSTEAPTEPQRPCFSQSDTVSVNNHSGKTPPLEQLLCQPLQWQLRSDKPTVLILHTHGSEAYADCPDYRSLEADENMVYLGKYLQTLLEQAGIAVIHDETVHDYPSYNGSYNHARKSIQQYLEEYPSILLVLDLHRDAMEDAKGNQIGTTVTINGQTCAQLMMVVGTNAGGLKHPNWQENLALAVKLHAQLERQQPGITRPISLRSQRFNQDLSPGAMLIEIGAAGNTQAQAKLATEQLAAAIIALSHGTS